MREHGKKYETAAKKRALARLLLGQRDTAQALVDTVGRTAAKTAGPMLGLNELESASAVAAADTSETH